MPSLAEYRRLKEEQAALDASGAVAQEIRDLLHPKQSAFVSDASRRKAALCSRRAGKSNGLAYWYVEGGLSDPDPDGMSLYVTRSKGDARRIMMPGFRKVERALGISLREFEEDNQLYVGLPNGHRIWLAGCNDVSEVGKFEGPFYTRAAVDEAQNFASKLLKTLVEDSIEPALLDKRGPLALTGTPGAIPAGYFYEATTQGGKDTRGWPTHRWTIIDNSFLPHGRDELARMLQSNYGGDANHPTYVRSWLGQWVLDMGALVYPYDALRNGWDGKLPTGELRYCIGVDLGFTAPSAIVVGCRDERTRQVFILESWGQPGLTLPQLAHKLRNKRAEYPTAKIVIDEGGLGKGYAETLRQTYGIPCEPAKKSERRSYQELVRGYILAGLMKFATERCGDLIDEMQVLCWDEEGEHDEEGLPNHRCDAMLYLTREIAPRDREEPQHPPADEDEPHRVAKRMREEAIKRIEDKRRKEMRRDPRAALRKAVNR